MDGMENASGVTDNPTLSRRVSLYGQPPPFESAANRASRVAGRTARLAFLSDAFILGLLSLTLPSISPEGPSGISGVAALTLWAIVLASYAVSSLYATVQQPDRDVLSEARRVAIAIVVAAAAWTFIATIAMDQVIDGDVSLLLAAWAVFGGVTTLMSWRAIRRRAALADPDRVLIVGAGHMAQELARRIAVTPGMDVAGFVDNDPMPIDPSLGPIQVFDDSTDLGGAIESTEATRLVIAFSRRSADQVLESLRNSRFGGIPVTVVPRYFEITPSHARLSEIDGIPMLDLHSARLSRGARLTKRALDIVLAGGALIVLSPLMLAVAIAVKATSRGPVFFGQLRTGRDSRPFRMWKFRTMIADAERYRMDLAHLNDMNESGPLFKIRNDPRITKVGGFLRRFSIDELPQLWNVLTGSMSLVGPRPFVVHESDQMEGWSRRRLDLVPGITGLWQVRGRNEVPYEEMIRLDYLYVTNWSVWWDLRLMLQTIPRVLTGRGAS
jgi:exopolysaccharide biosynthesis polyprenyl glycosylphosphotransferase